MKVLVVTSSFGDYERGHVISDKDEQDKVLESNPQSVVVAEHPDN